MKNRFTPAGGPAPDPFMPEPQAVPAMVETAGDTLFPVQTSTPATEGQKQVKAKDLLKQGTDTLLGEVFQPGLSAQFIWSLRMIVQFVLLKLRALPTTPMLSHTQNAEARLVPAIEALLKGAPIIEEEEPRALKEIDLKRVAERKDQLVQYREVWKLLMMAAECVEAGTTHLEQYLDGTARAVYPHVVDLIAADRNAADILEALVALVGEPAVLAQQTKKDRAKLIASVTGQGQAEAGPPPVVTTPTAPTIPVTTPTAIVTPVGRTSVTLAGPAPRPAGTPLRTRGNKRRK